MRHKRALKGLKETDLIFSLQTPFLSRSVTPDLSHAVIFAHSTIDERDTGYYAAANRFFQTPIRVVLARYLNFYYVWAQESECVSLTRLMFWHRTQFWFWLTTFSLFNVPGFNFKLRPRCVIIINAMSFTHLFFFDSHIFVTYYTKQLLKLEQIIGAHSYNSTLDTRRLFHWDVAFIWENMAVS